MARPRFHHDVDYRLYARGEEEPRGHMEYLDRLDYSTVPRFLPDDVLLFRWKYGVQQSFFHDVYYEIEGPAGKRTTIRYVDRMVIDDRPILVFRRPRRRAPVEA